MGFVTNTTAPSTGELQQHRPVAIRSNAPSGYGDGPGALVSHRPDAFPLPGAPSAVAASGALNGSTNRGSSGVTASAADAPTSRHRNSAIG